MSEIISVLIGMFMVSGTLYFIKHAFFSNDKEDEGLNKEFRKLVIDGMVETNKRIDNLFQAVLKQGELRLADISSNMKHVKITQKLQEQLIELEKWKEEASPIIFKVGKMSIEISKLSELFISHLAGTEGEDKQPEEEKGKKN